MLLPASFILVVAFPLLLFTGEKENEWERKVKERREKRESSTRCCCFCAAWGGFNPHSCSPSSFILRPSSWHPYPCHPHSGWNCDPQHRYPTPADILPFPPLFRISPCIFPALHALTHIFICLIFLSNTFPLFALPSCIIFSLHPPRFRIFRTPTYWETFAVSNSFFMSMSTKSYHNRTHNRVAFGIFSRLPEKHLSGYNSYADSVVELFF